jgi:acetyl esterase
MPVVLDPDAAAVYQAYQEAGRPPYETVCQLRRASSI